MLNKDGNSSTSGGPDSGRRVVLELHHVVECFTNDVFGDHSDGHFTDPPRLVTEPPHQCRHGIVSDFETVTPLPQVLGPGFGYFDQPANPLDVVTFDVAPGVGLLPDW